MSKESENSDFNYLLNLDIFTEEIILKLRNITNLDERTIEFLRSFSKDSNIDKSFKSNIRRRIIYSMEALFKALYPPVGK